MTLNGPALPGDILVFDNSDFSDVASLVTHVVPNGIEVVTDSCLSHSAMVWEDPAYLIESTITFGAGGIDGPQWHPIDQRLRATRGRAWLLSLSPDFRGGLDFPAMWAYARGQWNCDTYAVGGLAKWLAAHAPVLEYIPWFRKPIPHQEYCSQEVIQIFQAGGQLPRVNPAMSSPASLAALQIYSGMRQLCGRPGAIANFNCT